MKRSNPSGAPALRGLPLTAALAIGVTGCGPGPTGGEAGNTPPDVRSVTVQVDHDIPMTIALTVSDADGDALTVGAPSAPEWITFDPTTATLTGTPGNDRVGQTVHVAVTASDGLAESRGVVSIRVGVGTSTLVRSGPWIQQTPHKFLHDGHPVESAHFLVYNDFSGPGVKDTISEMFEELLPELGARLGVQSDAEYQFPPGGRLHMMADRFQGDPALGYSTTVFGWAFPDGVLVMAPDAPRYPRLGYNPARYRALLTHELMHNVEWLLIGRSARHRTDVWFREGIASYMAGLGCCGVPLSSATNTRMSAWRSAHSSTAGRGNPIDIHVWDDFPSGVDTGSYYLWFGTAVRYLSDPAGFGLGDPGLRRIYDDLRAGMTFAASFEAQTGMSLTSFEADFWNLMSDFLPDN